MSRCIRQKIRLTMLRSTLGIVAMGLVAPALSPAYAAQKKCETALAIVVGKEPISTFDIVERTRMTALFVGQEATTSNMKKLVPSVIRMMINESLQRQEANKYQIKASDEEIQTAIRNIEKNNRMGKGALAKFLKKNNLNPALFHDHLRASIVWTKYVREKQAAAFRVVGESEVEKMKAQIKNNRNTVQYHLSEIVVPFDKKEGGATKARQDMDIVVRMLQHAPFPVVAQQFSQSPSAVRGGDLGWLSENDLPSAARKAVKDLAPGTLSDIIPTGSSYTLFALLEKQDRAPKNAPLPSREEIEELIRRERFEKLARFEMEQLLQNTQVTRHESCLAHLF